MNRLIKPLALVATGSILTGLAVRERTTFQLIGNVILRRPIVANIHLVGPLSLGGGLNNHAILSRVHMHQPDAWTSHGGDGPGATFADPVPFPFPIPSPDRLREIILAVWEAIEALTEEELDKLPDDPDDLDFGDADSAPVPAGFGKFFFPGADTDQGEPDDRDPIFPDNLNTAIRDYLNTPPFGSRIPGRDA